MSRCLKDRKPRGLSVECRGENGPAREVLERGRSREHYSTPTLLIQTPKKCDFAKVKNPLFDGGFLT